MMGLDVTHQALLDRQSAQALRALGTRSGVIAAELTEFALERNLGWSGSTTSAVHDAVAVAHLLMPDLVAVARYNVAVETGHGAARGRTVCDGLPNRLRRRGLEANADIGVLIDRDRFVRLLLDAYARLP
jgi:inosine-uridine nucleoside N-ribohydrolase